MFPILELKNVKRVCPKRIIKGQKKEISKDKRNKKISKNENI